MAIPARGASGDPAEGASEMCVVGKAGAYGNGADGASVASKLLACPGNALAAEELTHRITKPFAKQLREVHRVDAGDLRHFGEARCDSRAGAQIFRAPIETSMWLKISA